MKNARMLIPLLCCLMAFPLAGHAQANEEVTKVYVLFKTHLDVGFTDLSSVVTERYMNEFIPKALEVSEKLRADGSGERYVWTTGSWLLWKYLRSAAPREAGRLEEAFRRGDIAWNAVPYTVESETMNRDLFEAVLRLSRKLDRKYGKQTIAAKMTDVPGHTRSIIAPMCGMGIRFLHVGVNPASPIPDVPAYCRWRNRDGQELILAYQQDYGTESLLPGGKTAVAINFTGDNHGPHSYEQVKAIYAGLRKRYPKAALVGASFNEVAQELVAMKEALPLVTSEIGDTWIYGYGSAPMRMAKFRKLSSLYSQWLREGKLDKESEEALDFAVELGLIAEHTQGMDIKTHLRNWDKYDMDPFIAARSSEPFRRVEQSWKEIDGYVDSAIACLPAKLQKQAREEMRRIEEVEIEPVPAAQDDIAGQSWEMPVLDGLLNVSGVSYQMLDSKDYDRYLDRYLRARHDWALDDIGKTGLEQSGAVSVSLRAQAVRRTVKKERKGTRVIADLAFPRQEGVDERVYPEKMQVDCLLHKGGKKADVSLTLFRKPAVRLPEAYWISFQADRILEVVAEKVGERVDLSDVVERGNRQMHGIDRYVDLKTAAGTIRIWSEAAFLVSVGEARGLAYSTACPDKEGGVHFNLSNNLWGTNFSMWNEGSLTYRFTIEKIESYD